jgi:hypothetical protein
VKASLWCHDINGQVAGMKRTAPPERRERKNILMRLSAADLMSYKGMVTYK